MRIFKTPEQELWTVFAASELPLLGAGIWAYRVLRNEHVPLILHFSPYTGINQIGSLRDLLAVLATGMILVGMNTVLAFVLVKRDPVLARLVALTTLLIALLLFIGFLAIMSVNS